MAKQRSLLELDSVTINDQIVPKSNVEFTFHGDLVLEVLDQTIKIKREELCEFISFIEKELKKFQGDYFNR